MFILLTNGLKWVYKTTLYKNPQHTVKYKSKEIKSLIKNVIKNKEMYVILLKNQ